VGLYSRQVWAPELIRHKERWYIYFAASDGKNESHLTYVLASKSANPLGEYALHGPLYTGDNSESGKDNLWAIDMTVMVHNSKLYAIWSGWSDKKSDQQFLYIAPMQSPFIISGNRVRICNNADYLWERTEEKLESRGLHEAPQVLQRNGRTFVVYSCGASWLRTYKLGMLELTGEDPLDPGCWKKSDKPVFAGTPRTFGVGHGSFTLSPDEKEWWHVYHAKMDSQPGWRRAIFIQRMNWGEKGWPLFGKPVDAGQPLDLPSGTEKKMMTKAMTWNFADPSVMDMLDYYGYHMCVCQTTEGIELAVPLQEPLDTYYQSGEKFVMRGLTYTDLDMTCRLTFKGGRRDAGVLFRVTAPSVGYDAQRGYFAGLVSSRGSVVFGKMDGKNWHHLKEEKIKFDPKKEQSLRVVAKGKHIEIFAAGSEKPQIVFDDGDYTSGSVGCRSVNSYAVFHSLEVKPL
jgi:GH43 family beta-xylosidase